MKNVERGAGRQTTVNRDRGISRRPDRRHLDRGGGLEDRQRTTCATDTEPGAPIRCLVSLRDGTRLGDSEGDDATGVGHQQSENGDEKTTTHWILLYHGAVLPSPAQVDERWA